MTSLLATPAHSPADHLATAAFGENAQLWPLPAAATPLQHWHRAVAAAGQGYYGVALTELDDVTRARPGAALLSLALSTRASLLRQLGRHRQARGFDGRALGAADHDPQAVVDALVGLAADALGVGRLAVSARLLQRAHELPDTPRQTVRRQWVAAELAMAGGAGATALAHAERAVAAADTLGSLRHRVKSQVVLAAALCCAGELQRSRHVADAAFAVTAQFGLVPLHWALGCLLADIGSEGFSPAAVAAARDEAADTVRSRGGVWSRR